MNAQHIPLDATTKTWRKQDVPRAFRLHFNQSKLKSANPVKRQEYQEWQELCGVVFPSGLVSLDRNFVNFFHSMSDLEEHCARIGQYDITFADEQVQP